MERQEIHFLHSSDVVTHRNNNPSVIQYKLPVTLPDVTSIRLLSYSIPYTPTFIVIRVSDWEADGTVLTSLDDIHQKAVWLEAKLKTYTSIETVATVATIYNDDSSVSLGVVECFTFINYNEDDTEFKTYDVFVCTGSVTTTGRTGWRLSLADLGTITEFNEDGDGSGVSLAVTQDRVYMYVDAGQGYGRLYSRRVKSPEWESFYVYRRGQIVRQAGSTYVCLENHMSLIFSRDLDTHKFWQVTVLDTEVTTSAAHGALHVIETTAGNQALVQADVSESNITLKFPPRDISDFVITMRNVDQRPFIFPHNVAIEFKSFEGTGSDVAVLHRKYEEYTLALEFTYHGDR